MIRIVKKLDDPDGLIGSDMDGRILIDLVELSPDALFALDHNGRFVFANSAAEVIFGKSIDQILGESLCSYFAKEHKSEIYKLAKLNKDEIWDKELVIVNAQKKEKYVRIRCRFHPADRARGLFYIGVLRDRTDRHKMELKLNRARDSLIESEQKMQNLLENLPDVVFSLDSTGSLVYINGNIEDLLGYSVIQMLGAKLWDYADEGDRELAETIMNISSGRVWDEELALKAADGDLKWVRIRASSCRDSNGVVTGFEGVIRDRTLRKRLEESLKASKNELMNKMRIIDDLYEHIVQSEKSKAIALYTAEVAHELKQPLAVIGGFACRMRSKLDGKAPVDPKTQRECLDFILAETKRLEAILNRLMDYNRKQSIQLESLDPNIMINRIVSIFGEKIKEKNLEVDLDLGGELGLIRLDGNRFEHVIRNLLTNAIEASRTKGRIRIATGVFIPSEKAGEIGSLEYDAYFELKIQNCGPRIPEDAIAKIFDPFYTTKDHGAGVGLTLIKRIVEEHKGSISVKSDEDYTEFTVWIPIDLNGARDGANPIDGNSNPIPTRFAQQEVQNACPRLDEQKGDRN